MIKIKYFILSNKVLSFALRNIDMSITKSDRPALILIDIQIGFEDIEWHCSSIPTSLLHESNPGNEFNELVTPWEGEPIIKKNVNSAFIGTGLQAQLDNARITKLVIAGLTTDHCISTTTRMAGNLGYDTYLVSDATATFNKKGLRGQNYPAELIHETALASLNEEFASIVTTRFIKNIFQIKLPINLTS